VARLREQFGPREEVTLLSDAAHYVLDAAGAACGAQAPALPLQEEAVA
jgi:hypothetical protein